MIRSPEPLHWERTALTVEAVSRSASSDIPGDIKLIAASLAASVSIQENVTLLVRVDASLAGHRIEWRPLPDATTPEPVWTAYYAFDSSETPLESGTQIIVYSGMLADAPTPEPGTTQRAVAVKSEDATVRFASPGVELRLLAPNGSVVHQRQFLTNESFTPLEMRALRNADGTALLLCLPAGVTPPAGLAALKLTFVLLRDAGAELPVWRRSGSDTAEVASLIVPLVS